MGKYFYDGPGRWEPVGIIKDKTITENGTYKAIDDQADGFGVVTVNVEGGGGSSDFSTAEVTFINSGEAGTYYLVFDLPIFDDTSGAYAPIISEAIPVVTQTTVNIILYKGKARIGDFANADMSVMPTMTGGLAVEGKYVVVTGDGTFTAVGQSGDKPPTNN